jgi:CHASE1-domain containing sensor protein
MKVRLYNLLPVAMLLIVMFTTFLVWRNVINSVDLRRQERFDGKVLLVEAAIRDRLAIYSDAQYAGAGFFLGSTEVTRHDWYEFVKAIHILKSYPGVNGLGFALPVKLKDTANFVKKIRQDNAPTFRIRTYKNSQPNDELFIITYIEPHEYNKLALGFDMGSEPRRREALEKARDIGKPVITKRVVLIQDTANRPGFLMYVPFYKDGNIPTTIEERRKNFLGWVYAPFIVEDFMEAIRSISFTDGREIVHLEVFDDRPLNELNLIYESKDNKKAEGLNSTTKEIKLYNNTWILRLSPTPALAKLYSHKPFWFIWLAGALLSISLSYVVYLLLSMRRRALVLARSMTLELRMRTKELRQKNMQLESSNRDLEQFAYVASHDLKEPLRMVNIYTQLLAERYKKQLDEEGKSYVQFATEGASRMSSLLNDLLMYSKLNNTKIKTEIVNVEDILRNVQHSLKTQIN